MTTYKELTGVLIKRQTTNPSDPQSGEVWYNNASGSLRGLAILEAFSSAAPLATKREGAGGFGTQTTAVICGGETPSVSGATEEYDGTGFSAGGTMNTARYRLQGTAGTATAGIVFGGAPFPSVSTATETYNGTAWTTSPYSLNTARWCAGAGIQTSALAFGGGPGYKNNTEEYDGEGWTAGNTLNTSRNSGYGAGTQTAAILIGGIVGPGTMQSAAETWDGTNWTTSPASLATARGRLSVAGSSTAAIAMAGQTPSITTATEEYNKSTNIITAAAWASGTSLTRNHGEHIGGAGSAADGLAFGGEGPSNYEYTEEWNGSTWTNGGNWPLKAESIMGCGLTGTTALGFGGIGNAPGSPPVTRQTTSAKYDGSAWTTTNSLPTAKRAGQGFGTNTAAVCMGGDTSPSATQNTVEEWDGTNWTAVPNAPFEKGNMGGGTGTLTAGLVFGGGPSTTGTTYEYDGTNWTAGGTMNTARNQVNGWGGPAGQTASMCGGGNDGSVTGATEGYDGTSWSTRPNLATARQGSANGIGTSQTTGIQAGGSTGSYVTNTEEFTGETTSANIGKFTTS